LDIAEWVVTRRWIFHWLMKKLVAKKELMTEARIDAARRELLRPGAVRAALSYYRAWSGHDFDQAMSYIADDIVCDAPAGRIEGAESFREFMGPFSQIVTHAELIGAFGDDNTALIMYGTDTVPVHDAPGAEYVKVSDGRIRYMRIVFDRAPFDEARRANG
jgi:hypothetical protein